MENELEKLKINIHEENKKITLKSENRIKIRDEHEKKKVQEIKEKIEKRKEEHQQKGIEYIIFGMLVYYGLLYLNRAFFS